ncbi:hypothetical protein ACFRDV_22155 [Streptomyces fagopyri]|uniref:hypothetical protein n=1 Tax=Streptomyces fagopyri TaxID=2662397 RepID=UPI0036C62891
MPHILIRVLLAVLIAEYFVLAVVACRLLLRGQRDRGAESALHLVALGLMIALGMTATLPPAQR